jgi:CRISPR-associated endonuclease Csy4
MDHYIEIRLLPNPQVPESALMSILFSRLHHALFQEGRGEIGVSFPKAEISSGAKQKRSLGDRIRLHGSKQALERLMKLEWHKNLEDYFTEPFIRPVPKNCAYCVVKRVQTKSNPERLYRRSVKKGKISLEDAEKKILECHQRTLKEPFVQLKSRSSGQLFRLFIQHGEILQTASPGAFSSYGLSSGATVPWF